METPYHLHRTTIHRSSRRAVHRLLPWLCLVLSLFVFSMSLWLHHYSQQQQQGSDNMSGGGVAGSSNNGISLVSGGGSGGGGGDATAEGLMRAEAGKVGAKPAGDIALQLPPSFDSNEHSSHPAAQPRHDASSASADNLPGSTLDEERSSFSSIGSGSGTAGSILRGKRSLLSLPEDSAAASGPAAAADTQRMKKELTLLLYQLHRIAKDTQWLNEQVALLEVINQHAKTPNQWLLPSVLEAVKSHRQQSHPDENQAFLDDTNENPLAPLLPTTEAHPRFVLGTPASASDGPSPAPRSSSCSCEKDPIVALPPPPLDLNLREMVIAVATSGGLESAERRAILRRSFWFQAAKARGAVVKFFALAAELDSHLMQESTVTSGVNGASPPDVIILPDAKDARPPGTIAKKMHTLTEYAAPHTFQTVIRDRASLLMLRMIEWMTARYNFVYMLKTEDYADNVNLERIFKFIDTNEIPNQKLIMGHERVGIQVDLNSNSKARDTFFFESTGLKMYPRHMVGRGILFTADVARAVVAMAMHVPLNLWRRDDVSFGVWTLCFNVTRIHDSFGLWSS